MDHYPDAPARVSDITRIEAQLSQIAETLQTLVRVETRQAEQDRRIVSLEERTSDTDKEILRVDRKLDKWIWLATGAWAVVVCLFEVYRVYAMQGH